MLYRYKIARKDYVTQHVQDAIGLVNEALLASDAISNGIHEAEQRIPSIVPLICELIIRNLSISGAEGARRVVEEFPLCANAIHRVLDVLLGLEAHGIRILCLACFLYDANQRLEIPGPQKAQSIVELLDDFSLPFCLIKLQLLLESKTDEEETKNSIVDLLFRTAEMDVRNGERRWLEVLTVLPVNAAQLVSLSVVPNKVKSMLIILKIRQRAERELLSLPIPSTSLREPSYEEAALIYLRIVDELSYSIPDEFSSTKTGTELGSRLLALLQKAVEFGDSRKDSDTTGLKAVEPSPRSVSSPEELSVGLSFLIILRLVALHRSSLSISSGPKLELNTQTRLLIQICCITRSPLFASRLSESFGPALRIFTQRKGLLESLPSTWAEVQVFALDVCSALADTLSDEARIECTRFLREKCPVFLHPQNDPRLLFLLGPLTENVPPSTHFGLGASTASSSAGLVHHLQSIPNQTQSLPTSTIVEDPNFLTHRLHFQQNGRLIGAYPHKPWEMLGEAAPIVGINDTPVNLAYFGTRQTKGF